MAKEELKTRKAVCRSCHKTTNHDIVFEVEESGKDDDDSIWWHELYAIHRCRGCEVYSFFRETHSSEDVNPVTQQMEKTGVVYPEYNESFLEAKSFWEVPARIRRIYRETLDCFNRESFTLCSAGVRAILEAICADKGVKAGKVPIVKPDGSTELKRQKNLEGKVWGLKEADLVTEKHAKILHHLRFIGNDAVHELAPPDSESLQTAISILEHTLEHVYEIEDRASRIRRGKKK